MQNMFMHTKMNKIFAILAILAILTIARIARIATIAERMERVCPTLTRHLLLWQAPWMATLPDTKKKTEGRNLMATNGDEPPATNGSMETTSILITPQTMWTMPSFVA